MNQSQDNLNSFGSQINSHRETLPTVRKSLKDLYAEKKKQGEEENFKYGGIANQILKSPFKVMEIQNLQKDYAGPSPTFVKPLGSN
jgi:hypothetical protein